MKEKNVVIRPMNLNNLGNASYDMRLGEYIWRMKGTVDMDIFDECSRKVSRGYQGKYQPSSDLDVLIEQWKPEDMIPMLWKDRDLPLLLKGRIE